MNKNNILYVLLIISVLILFFHPNGVIALMNNQSKLIRQEKEIKKLEKEIKKLEKEITLFNDTNYNQSNFKRLEPYFKEKGIIKKDEEYYNLQQNNN